MQKNKQDNRIKKVGKLIPFNRQILLGTVTLVAAAVLLIIGLYPRSANAPQLSGTPLPENPADAAGTVASTRVESGCELIQEASYSRCGHTTTRRTQLPQELDGKTRQEVEAVYGGWQVTEFLPKRITMARKLEMYCADHVVLMPDETGVLSVFQNKYGDAMAFVESLDMRLDSLPEASREEVRAGKGFDTLADLEEWLENMES